MSAKRTLISYGSGKRRVYRRRAKSPKRHRSLAAGLGHVLSLNWMFGARRSRRGVGANAFKKRR